ncbi:MAG: hypothetical protein Q9172_007093 [Xanthocarpia lactea]
MPAIKRAAEKTFGPSPESNQRGKRQKLASSEQKITSRAIVTSDDSEDSSDMLFMPPKSTSKARDEHVATKNVRRSSREVQNCHLMSHTVEPSSTDPTSTGSTTAPIVPRDRPTEIASPAVKPSALRKPSDKPKRPTRGLNPATRIPKSAGNILDTLGDFPGLLTPEDPPTRVVENEQQGTDSVDFVRAQVLKPKPQSSWTGKSRQSHIGKQMGGTILVGVDFGTTFSGLCWAQTRRPKYPKLIQQWPDSVSDQLQGETRNKVPTEVQYTNGREFRWGFQIRGNVQRQKWFKLALDPDNGKSDMGQAPICSHPDPKAAPPGYDLQPEDIVEDYLTALRKHFEAVFRRSLPLIAVSTPIEYIITVPAMWSDLAVQRTRECAEKAGMGEASNLSLVSEPEAAAIWALQELEPGSLAIGDVFIVCDAGGGTVDLISYRVTKLEPILRVTEVVPGCGKKCGSTFLNRAFELLLKGKLERYAIWDEDMLEDAMKRFELETKREFDGSTTVDYLIPVPGAPDILNNEDCYIRNTRFSLKGANLYNIFEPIVQDVLGLVQHQIKATKTLELSVKAILLVGGFGENSYLHQRLCASVSGENIEVYKPAHGWTAVVRGAVSHGLARHSPRDAEVAIDGHCPGVHYGTESAKEYNDKKHRGAQRFWSAANNRFEVNTYDWFITKGQTLSENKPLRLYYHTESLTSLKKIDPIVITIVQCADPENKGAPLFVGDGKVTTHATLEVPLTQIPTKNLVKRRSENGQEWYIVDFSLKVIRRSAEFEYVLMRNTKAYGSVRAEFI